VKHCVSKTHIGCVYVHLQIQDHFTVYIYLLLTLVKLRTYSTAYYSGMKIKKIVFRNDNISVWNYSFEIPSEWFV